MLIVGNMNMIVSIVDRSTSRATHLHRYLAEANCIACGFADEECAHATLRGIALAAA